MLEDLHGWRDIRNAPFPGSESTLLRLSATGKHQTLFHQARRAVVRRMSVPRGHHVADLVGYPPLLASARRSAVF
jgi:hypothetical protein